MDRRGVRVGGELALVMLGACTADERGEVSAVAGAADGARL
jgi:hypothetical protein